MFFIRDQEHVPVYKVSSTHHPKRLIELFLKELGRSTQKGFWPNLLDDKAFRFAVNLHGLTPVEVH